MVQPQVVIESAEGLSEGASPAGGMGGAAWRTPALTDTQLRCSIDSAVMLLWAGSLKKEGEEEEEEGGSLA